MRSKSNRKAPYIAALIFVVGIAAGFGLALRAPAVGAGETVVVYKSPTCGCCKEWVKHLQQNGYRVEVHEQ